MLRERYDQHAIESALLPREGWHPYPPASDRPAWDAVAATPLGARRNAYLIGRAETLLGTPWPALPATLYMEFQRNGNRSRFQAPYFERRKRLGDLVLAECLDGRGRFLDEIANGLWAICEESSWCLPAHSGYAVPDPDDPIVDLFAAETAMELAQALDLLAPQLETISPVLARRVRNEIDRKVTTPVLEGEFGWSNGHNNWTPWCSGNTLGAAMLIWDDNARLSALADKLNIYVDRFISHYAPDGGCDEGPTYWGVAAGALLQYLEHLHMRTNGAITVYDEPLVRAMGRFILAAHQDGTWFFNFGDGAPKALPAPAMTYRYGERTGDTDLQALARLSARRGDPEGEPELWRSGGNGRAVTHGLQQLFWTLDDEGPLRWKKPLRLWLPDLQLLNAREKPALGAGFVLGAKGHHNAASHNHNDVGHFILTRDGAPLVVDVGVEEYCKKTFGPDRYEIWTMQSSSHNVPVVNGAEQMPGEAFAATSVTFTESDTEDVLAMRLEPAYGEDAGLVRLQRTWTLRRGGTPTVTAADECEIKEGPLTLRIPFYTPATLVEEDGGIRFINGGASALLRIEATDADVETKIDAVELEDDLLRRVWGASLNRLTVVVRSDAPKVAYRLTWQ